MAILDPLVLPADVVIAPIADLPEGLRDQFEHQAGDYSVTRPRARMNSSVVSRKTATLLESFRSPTTIVDAVIAYSEAEGVDPRETLDDAFPVLGGFVADGLLVSADSELAAPIATTLAEGDDVAGLRVEEPVHVLVDTEVYRATTADGPPAAIKIARLGATPELSRTLAHEAGVLGGLDGEVNPRLLARGEHDGRPFIAVSWCFGADALQASAEARELPGREGRAALLDLVQRIVDAYAHLHGQRVLHGDVHPRNVLVDASGRVTIIDYGFAAGPETAPAPGWRGGIDFFMEPELAAARREGRIPPALNPAGEQYSLAALVYLLITGANTHAFSLEPAEMLGQLLDEPALPFSRHAVDDLAAVERVLGRALAKDPADRYGSLTSLAAALRNAATCDLNGSAAVSAGRGSGRQLVDHVLERLAVPGQLFDGGLEAPTASPANGGAGFAYALMRIAGVRDDEELLAEADLWGTRAALSIGTEEAFWNTELEVVPETFGERSFHHTAVGVHCIQALIASARNDDWARQIAVEEFAREAAEPCERVDVVVGQAGLMIGCGLLLPAAPSIARLGDELAESFWQRLQSEPPLAAEPGLRYLGAAHGWAGYLFALLRWSEATGAAVPVGMDERLDQLAELGYPIGRGLSWPHQVGLGLGDPALAASWCNGAAGFVHLWLAAQRALGDDRFAVLAERAAWSTYEAPVAPGDLCCGFAGRAYALLSLYRDQGDATWLARARLLADHAITGVQTRSMRRDSLYRGEVGVALLAAELEQPEHARMPLFDGDFINR